MKFINKIFNQENKQYSTWSWLNNFITRFYNAKTVIQQIRNGEWEPCLWSTDLNMYLAAKRDGLELWIGNGPFFCEIEKKEGTLPYFGLFWRHWVYWAAVRKLLYDADQSKLPKRKLQRLY
jgi:hypothetical protein